MITSIKRIARRVSPPRVWDAMHRVKSGRWSSQSPVPFVPAENVARPAEVPPPATRVLRSVEELDREIARSDAAASESQDAMIRTFAEYRFEIPLDIPADPHSDEYRQVQMNLHEAISGRNSYSPDRDENTPFDMASALIRPYPYCTNSSTIVGNQLMAIGFLIRAMDAPAGSRILEFGAGHGKTTFEMAHLFTHITAVDVAPTFVELNRERFSRLGLPVEVVQSDMLTYESSVKFDRVLFYESFHHCPHPDAMVARLDSLVAEGGAVIFAGEPIIDNYPIPWGVRLDGQSLWSIRKFGWMELGFDTRFFMALLSRHGWEYERFTSLDVPWQQVFVARRKRLQ